MFITRGVPAPERRQKPRAAGPPPSPESLETYREMLARRDSGWALVKRGALGLALVGMAGWMWRRNSRTDGSGAAGADDEQRRDQ